VKTAFLTVFCAELTALRGRWDGSSPVPALVNTLFGVSAQHQHLRRESSASRSADASAALNQRRRHTKPLDVIDNRLFAFLATSGYDSAKFDRIAAKRLVSSALHGDFFNERAAS